MNGGGSIVEILEKKAEMKTRQNESFLSFDELASILDADDGVIDEDDAMDDAENEIHQEEIQQYLQQVSEQREELRRNLRQRFAQLCVNGL